MGFSQGRLKAPAVGLGAAVSLLDRGRIQPLVFRIKVNVDSMRLETALRNVGGRGRYHNDFGDSESERTQYRLSSALIRSIDLTAIFEGLGIGDWLPAS